jgi:HAD superfamily hydrolase (TIGR01509 family)
MVRSILEGLSAILFDVDGTLVDSNAAHADAWVRAFREAGIDVDPAEVRVSIGMGGDKLMPRVSGLDRDSPRGERIAARRQEIFMVECMPLLRAFPGARDLVIWLKRRELTVVAASSATSDELNPLLDVADVRSLLDGATSSDDAEESKPDPDIVHAALARAQVTPADAVMIGDTPYDIDAAAAAGVKTIAFRTGGWSDRQLGGAMAIYDGPWDMLDALRAA